MKITMRNLLLSLALMSVWITASAENDFLTNTSSWANDIASPEFVPVEQAYNLTLSLKISACCSTGRFAMATTYTVIALSLDLWMPTVF